MANVFDSNRRAIIAADRNLADVLDSPQQAKPADIVELSALGIKTAARIGIIGGERIDHLHHGDVEIVELHRIEQDVILHGGSAETGIVRYAGDTAIAALDDPILEGMQFHRSA